MFNRRSIFFYLRQVTGFIFLTVLLTSTSLSSPTDHSVFEPGIRNGRGRAQLNATQKNAVANALLSKTGFSSIHFDETGWLRFAPNPGQGSETAQQLVFDAFRGQQVIELYSRERSSEVAFARMITSQIFESGRTGAQITIYHLEIDFSDFGYLNGDREARAAFDLGFILLHELTHIIRQIYDNNGSQTSPGDCADYINRIRQDLGMPFRNHYFPEIRKLARDGGTVYIARLSFSYSSKKSYSVFWDALKVGNIK